MVHRVGGGMLTGLPGACEGDSRARGLPVIYFGLAQGLDEPGVTVARRRLQSLAGVVKNRTLVFDSYRNR
jgi:hypothetical protein